MRFLYDHYFYASKSIHGISSFSLIRSLAHGCRRLGETVAIDYAAPKVAKDSIQWDADDLRGCGLFPHELGPSKMPREPYPFFEPEYVRFIRDKNYAADFLLTKTYAHVPSLCTLQHTLASKWELFLPLPIINYFTETTLDDALCKWGLNEDYAAGSIALSAACCPMFVLNPFDIQEVRRLIRRYLSSSLVGKALENIHVVPPSFEADYIDSQIPLWEAERRERRLSGRINVFHGGAVDPKRHVTDLVNAVEEVRRTGADVHVHLVTQTSQKFEQPWVHCVNNCSGRDYIDQFGKGDILWMAADYEGTGLGYMEAMRSGMIPICNEKALWVVHRMPGGYPFFFRNFSSEHHLMLGAMVKRFAEFKDSWQPEIIAKAGEWSSEPVARTFLDTAAKVIKPYTESNIETAKRCFAFKFLRTADERGLLPERVTLADVLPIMTSVTDKEFPFEWVGHRGIKYMLQALGYSDTCESSEIIMERT